MTGLSPELRDAVEGLARAGRLLVALDFDGTLAPFVDDPAQARPLPAASRAISELVTAPDTSVALVSGRSLASLRQVSSPDSRVLLVGSHGAERFAPEELGHDHERPVLDAERTAVLARVTQQLQAAAGTQGGPDDAEREAATAGGTGGTGGAWVEEKPAGAVLHTRQVEDGAAPDLMKEALRALQDLPDLTVTPGKDVIEVSVLPADKGRGLQWARDVSEAAVVLFAGDDRTDEHAFAVLRRDDVGIKVGPGRSAARFRVDGPGDVAELLQLLVDVRG